MVLVKPLWIMSQMLKANNPWFTELIYSQFLTKELMRMWVNPVAKSMLPNHWRVFPRWIQYCFSMLSIFLRSSFKTVWKGWVAISSTDNCCLVNSVNAVLIYNCRKLSLSTHWLSNTTRNSKHLFWSQRSTKTLVRDYGLKL